jgi:hypothetical protein
MLIVALFVSSGSAVCYQNTYPGNFYQWGCGSSNWATFVATTVNGNPKALPVQIVLTGNAAPAPQPTTIVGSTDTRTIVSTQVETKTAAPSTVTSAAAPSSTSTTETSDSEIPSPPTILTSSRERATSASSEPTAASHTPTTTQLSSPAISIDPSTSIGGAGVSTLPSPTPSSSPTSSPGNLPIGTIVGGAIGGLALLFAILGFCFIGRRRGWFSSSDRNNQYNEQPQSMAHAGEGPPHYSMPLPVSYDTSPERKAELPVHRYDMRDSAGNDIYSRNGGDDVSPWGSPMPLSDGTFRSRSRLSPVSVDEGYQRAGRNDPIYEVQ